MVYREFRVPYIGLPSFILGDKLREIFIQHYGITIRVRFTTFKVKNYFSLKCRTPTPLLANVVASNKSYIGKTKRHLATRVKEHRQGHLAIQSHLDECSACKDSFSCDLFSIIDSGSIDFDITKKKICITNHANPGSTSNSLPRALLLS